MCESCVRNSSEGLVSLYLRCADIIVCILQKCSVEACCNIQFAVQIGIVLYCLRLYQYSKLFAVLVLDAPCAE